MIENILLAVVVLFPISELTLAVVKRSRGGSARREDRGSMLLLWFSIALGVALAFFVQRIPWAHVPIPRAVAIVLALALMLAGLAVRWVAILTLGKFFTVDVAVHDDHAVVDHGLYRFMRHPSYTGLLIAFIGFGIVFTNWLSVVGLLVPIGLGITNRVAQEERSLRTSLGASYESYCDRTKRFVPGLF